MEQITFNELPHAVTQLYEKLINIEQLLLNNQNASNESDQLLTVKETAMFLALSTATIYLLVSEGKIPVSKRGKRLYFLKPELIEWVKSGRKLTKTEIKDNAHTYFLRKGGKI